MTNLLPVVKQRVHAAAGLSGWLGAARVDRSVEDPGRPHGEGAARCPTPGGNT